MIWQSWKLAIFSVPERRSGSRRLSFEILESREVPSATATPEYVLHRFGGSGSASPFGSPAPTGLSPEQIRHAYGFDQIIFNGGAIQGDGTGTTIAIVDAYDDPKIASDLHQFDVSFGLADPVFTKVNQSGGSNLPSANRGWASEIALDVEWAHAMAPGAKILLVEASSPSYTNLFAAVSYAAHQTGVVAVSMSWGGSEFSGETGYDGIFQTPAGHSGVTFIASSGDSGAAASYPAASPNVLAVGGTTLFVDSAGNVSNESAWSGSGGGISAVELQPAYQNGIVTQSSTRRANPDVSYDADPNSGFPVYDSYNNGTSRPWSQFGGTSAGSPQWAALVAIADQGLMLAGQSPLDGGSEMLPALYALPAGDYRDIITGHSSGSPSYSAGAGYDLATGLGSPHADLVVADLVGEAPPASGPTHFSVSGPASVTAGTPFVVTVSALDGSGNLVADYAGTVHFTSSDSLAGLPSDYTFAAGDQGTKSFTVVLETAGVRTVTVTDTSRSSINGAANESVSPAAPARVAFGQEPVNAGVGGIITPAVTVNVLDVYGNLETGDNSDQVSVAIGANPGGGALSGTTVVTVQGGIATFSNLSINQPGNGYTLIAGSGSLTGATSSAFNVMAGGTIIEDFNGSSSWYVAGGYSPTAYLATAAAHDGTYGLDDYNGNDWIYRSDAAAQVHAGDTVSVWLRFAGSANGRAYFGFGASSSGTLSLVAAPNTHQLLLQSNAGYGYADLAGVSQNYSANHWYRLEVDWGAAARSSANCSTAMARRSWARSRQARRPSPRAASLSVPPAARSTGTRSPQVMA